MKRVNALGARALACGLLLTAAGCASAPQAAAFSPELAPSTMAATSSAETEVLRRAPELPVGQPVNVSGVQVVAFEPYSAASGRVCRELRLDEQSRLACDGEGGWVFVPVLIEGP